MPTPKPPNKRRNRRTTPMPPPGHVATPPEPTEEVTTEQEVSLPSCGTPVQIPTVLQKMGAQREWKPTPLDQVRMWLTGLSGVGKTNFVMSNPGAFVFDFEGNCCDVVKPQAAFLETKDWVTFEAAYDWLIQDASTATGPRTFKHVVFDTFDKFKDLAIGKLTEDYNARRGSHRGEIRHFLRDTHGPAAYDQLQEFLITKLIRLQQVGYGWTVVGHSVNKEIREEEGVRIVTQATLYPSIIAPLYRETGFMGHIVRETETEGIPIPGQWIDKRKTVPKTEKKKVTKVRLQLAPSDPETTRGDIRETKARYLDHLPEVINVPLHQGWTKLSQVYEQAIESARKAG